MLFRSNNILSRCYFLPSLKNNLSLFYDYDIREEDSVDNLSYRYYDSSYRYWLLLYANEVVDPKSSWVLNYRDFNNYLFAKYKEKASVWFLVPVNELDLSKVIEYTKLDIHHYEKTITTTNESNKQVTKIVIDQNTYNNLSDLSVNEYVFNNGSGITVQTEKSIISVYDYEYALNESKRKIKIINKDYVEEAERSFRDLMK